MKFKCGNLSELKRFKTYAVYPKVRPFWIYTTVSFFKKPSPLFPCMRVNNQYSQKKSEACF